MSNSQFFPIILNLIAALLSAFGQYFYQIGALKIGKEPLYKNHNIFLGIVLFTAVMVLLLSAFKLGGRLSVTYPIYASTFLWGTLIGVFINKEPWNWGQSAGTLLVVIGIMIIASYSSQ